MTIKSTKSLHGKILKTLKKDLFCTKIEVLKKRRQVQISRAFRKNSAPADKIPLPKSSKERQTQDYKSIVRHSAPKGNKNKTLEKYLNFTSQYATIILNLFVCGCQNSLTLRKMSAFQEYTAAYDNHKIKKSNKTKQNQKQVAFSLVEMLMALLIASLLLAALAPVMTKKFSENINVTGNIGTAETTRKTQEIEFGSADCADIKIDTDGSEYCEGEFEVPGNKFNGYIKATVISAGGGAGGGGAGGCAQAASGGSGGYVQNVPITIPSTIYIKIPGGGGGGGSGAGPIMVDFIQAAVEVDGPMQELRAVHMVEKEAMGQ